MSESQLCCGVTGIAENCRRHVQTAERSLYYPRIISTKILIQALEYNDHYLCLLAKNSKALISVPLNSQTFKHFKDLQKP